STIVEMATTIRRGCLAGGGVFVCWLLVSHFPFAKKWLRAQWIVYLMIIGNLAIAALYAYSSNNIASSEINMYSVGVQEGKKVIMAASPTTYDVVISSTYFLTASIIMVFALPLHGIMLPVTIGVIFVLGYFGYQGHDDRALWYSYVAAGCLGAGFVTHRMQFKTRKEAMLELRNRDLVARQATMKLERDLELAREIQSSMDPPAEI